MRDHTTLTAWKVSRELAGAIHRLNVFAWSPATAAAFNQVQRASLSVPLNLAEGYVWRPGRKWMQHLRIAYGSAVETTDLLCFMRDFELVKNAELDTLITNSRRSQALIVGLLRVHQ